MQTKSADQETDQLLQAKGYGRMLKDFATNVRRHGERRSGGLA